MHGSLAFHSFFSFQERKSCGFKNIPIRVDGALIFLSTNIRQFSIRFQGPKRFNYFSTEIQNADSFSHFKSK